MSKEYRTGGTELASNTHILKRRLYAGTQGVFTGSSFMNFGPDVKTLKLSMVLLVFLYSTDDDKISILEKRSFNKAIHSINELSEEDKKELTELLNLLPNANYVLEYIRTNELSSAVVESAIKQLIGIVKLNKQDLKLLKDFTSQYKALDE